MATPEDSMMEAIHNNKSFKQDNIQVDQHRDKAKVYTNGICLAIINKTSSYSFVIGVGCGGQNSKKILNALLEGTGFKIEGGDSRQSEWKAYNKKKLISISDLTAKTFSLIKPISLKVLETYLIIPTFFRKKL